MQDLRAGCNLLHLTFRKRQNSQARASGLSWSLGRGVDMAIAIALVLVSWDET